MTSDQSDQTDSRIVYECASVGAEFRAPVQTVVVCECDTFVTYAPRSQHRKRSSSNGRHSNELDENR